MRQSRLWRAIDQWAARLLGAARAEGSFGDQEPELEANRTSQDYLWNTVGLAAWGMVFPVLTIVVTWLSGVEQAGMFSFSFVAASLLMIVGNYGVRTYQVSDRAQEHSFLDYQVCRWATCAVMLVAAVVFCNAHGYEGLMRTMTVWVVVYKMVDALADCYEGRLQQMDKLYLAGVSQTIRSAAAFLVFCLFLLVFRNLAVASVAMAVVAAVTFALVTLPLTLLETPKSAPVSWPSVGRLLARCAPLFVALFLYALVDNMPKFMMEGALPYENQLYFNALYFPAQAILMTVGVLYKPMLGRMADAWMDLSRRGRFTVLIGASLAAIAGITVVVLLLMAWIGVPLLGILYGVDFEQFRHLSYLMVIAGGLTGGIDFLYQVFTVMRRQAAVTKLYLVAIAFSLAVNYMLIHVSQLRGAVIAYLIVMAILLVLLVLEYVRILMDYQRHPEDDPTREAALARAEAAATAGDAEGADPREAARQERLLRTGGDVDPRYRARQALRARQQRRGRDDG